jgi:outer membrane protein W
MKGLRADAILQAFFTISACSWVPHWSCHYYRLETGSGFRVGNWSFTETDSILAMVVYGTLIVANVAAVVLPPFRLPVGVISGTLHLGFAALHAIRAVRPFAFEVFGYAWSTSSSVRETVIVGGFGILSIIAGIRGRGVRLPDSSPSARLGITVGFLLLFLPRMASADPEIEIGARYLTTRLREEDALSVHSSNGFGATAEAFWTERVSTQVSGTFIQPVAFVNDIDLGTLGLQTVAVTARFYARTRFAPFVGAGGAVVIPGDLDDRFGENLLVEFDTAQGFAAEAGVRYRRSETVAFELVAMYVPLELDLRVTRNRNGVPLPSTLRLDPVVLAVGASWRF